MHRLPPQILRTASTKYWQGAESHNPYKTKKLDALTPVVSQIWKKSEKKDSNKADRSVFFDRI